MSHDSSLEPDLRAVEPAVRLIPERYLRQVLHYLIDWGHPLSANTKLPYWVAREDLLAADILPPHMLTGAEPHLLLLSNPNDRMIDDLPVAEQLREYWRALFQAAIARSISDRNLSIAECQARLEGFGPAASREIGYVLLAEHLIAPEAGTTPGMRPLPRPISISFPSIPDLWRVSFPVCLGIMRSKLVPRTRCERGYASQ